MTEHTDCKFEDKIIQMCEDVATIKGVVSQNDANMRQLDRRINGSFDAIARHIDSGHRWRAMIVSITVAIVLQLIGFAYMYGNLCTTVYNNEKILTTVTRYIIVNAEAQEGVK